MTALGRIGTAIEALAGVFGDGMTAEHIGRAFTCNEADAVAELLVAAGYIEEAADWLVGRGLL